MIHSLQPKINFSVKEGRCICFY